MLERSKSERIVNKKIKQLTILYYGFGDIVWTVTSSGLIFRPHDNFIREEIKNEEEITWCSS